MSWGQGFIRSRREANFERRRRRRKKKRGLDCTLGTFPAEGGLCLAHQLPSRHPNVYLPSAAPNTSFSPHPGTPHPSSLSLLSQTSLFLSVLLSGLNLFTQTYVFCVPILFVFFTPYFFFPFSVSCFRLKVYVSTLFLFSFDTL